MTRNKIVLLQRVSKVRTDRTPTPINGATDARDGDEATGAAIGNVTVASSGSVATGPDIYTVSDDELEDALPEPKPTGSAAANVTKEPSILATILSGNSSQVMETNANRSSEAVNAAPAKQSGPQRVCKFVMNKNLPTRSPLQRSSPGH